MAEPAIVEEQEIEISSVLPDQVEYVWNTQLDQIRSVLRRGQGDMLSAGETIQAIKEKRAQMWAMHRGDDVLAFLVFSILVGERTTKVWVRMMVGRDMDLWAPKAYELFKEFIDLIGADCVEASCRPGVAKALKELGWTQKAVIMEMR